MKKKRLYLLLALLLLMLITGCQPRGKEAVERPRAKDGLLDFGAWDFVEDGPLDLDGQWEFYWGQLLEPGDFLGKEKNTDVNFIHLPRSWNGYIVQEQKLTGDGYASFRLNINKHKHDDVLALKIPIMCTAYKLWANGELLAENGRVGDSRREMIPQYRPQIAPLNDKGNSLELVIQVSNYRHRKGGIWESIRIGTEAQIRGQRDLALAFQLLLLGGFLALGIHYLGLYFVRLKEPYALFFSLASFLMALRVLLVGEIFLIQVFPNFNWEWELKLEYLTYYLSMLSLLMLLGALFPAEVSPVISKITTVLSLGYSGLALLTPAHIYTHTLTSYQLYSIFLVFYFIRVFIMASRHRREGAPFMLIGGIIYSCSILYDIFFSNFRTLAIGHLAPLGLFLFLLAQHLALMNRLSAAFFRLEDLSERLLVLDKLKDEFLAGVSHELRTPLSGILGIAQSVLDGASGPLSPRQRHSISLVLVSSKRLSILIDDIMDFYRLKNRDISLEPTALNLRQEVEQVLEVCRPLTRGKDLELQNQIPEDILQIKADENRLQQILYNLIGNAIKFTESGSITISALARKGLIEITISDTGIGIAPDCYERIFQPFEQADASISHLYGGTGLGLSVSKSLIELHGGTIWVESKPGLGSSFHFTLPLSIGPVAAAASGVQRPIAGPGSRIRQPLPETALAPERDPGKSLILVVDDDPINLQVLVNQLSLQEYQVITATSGSLALSLINKAGGNIDLVILDVMMPTMSGYEVSRRLRQRYSLFDLPILMLTAKNRIDDLTAGFEAGANDYIAKPFDKNELLARVHTLLALKQSVAHAMINQRLATIDELTGLHNRRLFFQVAPQEVKRAKVYGLPLSLIMFDIDQFKAVNDSHGHTVGDDVLRSIAINCQKLLRDEDLVARYGGDEFIALLTKDLPSTKQIAERLRREIASQPMAIMNKEGVYVSASFGVATVNENIADLADLLKKTDQALYQAKRQGRNRVIALV